MKYVFITQEGTLGKYIKPLRRKSKTGFKTVQLLDTALSQTVKAYDKMAADAENSQELWETLESIMIKVYNKMTEMEKKTEAFKEIYEWFLDVGDNIAFMHIRKGIPERIASMYYARFINCNKDSEEFVPLFLKEIICRYSKFCWKKETANSVLCMLSEMSEEELKVAAVEWQKGYMKKYDYIERFAAEKEREIRAEMANEWHDGLLSFTQRTVSSISEAVEIPF